MPDGAYYCVHMVNTQFGQVVEDEFPVPKAAKLVVDGDKVVFDNEKLVKFASYRGMVMFENRASGHSFATVGEPVEVDGSKVYRVMFATLGMTEHMLMAHYACGAAAK